MGFVQFTESRRISGNHEDFYRYRCKAVSHWLEAIVEWSCEDYRPYSVKVIAQNPKAEDWQIESDIKRIKNHCFF